MANREAQVHDPDELRERLEGDEAEAGPDEGQEDVRSKAEKFGITNADNYTDAGLVPLVRVRERAYKAQRAKEERTEAFKASLGDQVVEPEEASSTPGAADADTDGGDSDATATEGGEG